MDVAMMAGAMAVAKARAMARATATATAVAMAIVEGCYAAECCSVRALITLGFLCETPFYQHLDS